MAIDIDESKVQRTGQRLWLEWALATTAAMLLGFLPFLLVIEFLDVLWVRWLIPLWTGFLVGGFQWAVLRHYLTHSADWVIHGGAGWAFGFALGLLIIQLLARNFWGA